MTPENRFILPFTGIRDLHLSYKKILSLYLEHQDKSIGRLNKHNIKFEKLTPCGLCIDVSTVPDGVSLIDLIGDYNELNDNIEKIIKSI